MTPNDMELAQKLLVLSHELGEKACEIKQHKDDDDFDYGYKKGRKETYLELQGLVMKEVEQLLKED